MAFVSSTGLVSVRFAFLLLLMSLSVSSCSDLEATDANESANGDGGTTVKGTVKDAAIDTVYATQVVYLKVMPEFDDALMQFGLLVAKERLMTRILQVVHRDYSGYDIVFVTDTASISSDVLAYSTVELAGDDPGGQGLLGFDNTVGKDVGNERLDDYLGGYNSGAANEQYAGHGGIFVAEFLTFSPTLSNDPLADSRFDDVFELFVPSLGGTPAALNEFDSASPRCNALNDAVRVLGNLVGNTISHEVAHSLGLVSADGQYHNEADTPNMLMDKGGHRPFLERAELDGQGPEQFSTADRAYLATIL